MPERWALDPLVCPDCGDAVRIDPAYPGARLWLSIALAGQRKKTATRSSVAGKATADPANNRPAAQ